MIFELCFLRFDFSDKGNIYSTSEYLEEEST